MAIVLMLGAAPLAALMAAERLELGQAGASSRAVGADEAPAGDAPVPAGALHRDRNAPSLRESDAASRVSHSQTTSGVQPSRRSVLSEAASRARLRSIFVRQ